MDSSVVTTAREHHAPKNRSILIVDDNEAIHSDIRKILQRKKPALHADGVPLANPFAPEIDDEPEEIIFTIDACSSGEAALEKIQEKLDGQDSYALVFIDMRMPAGWNGIDTLQHIFAIDPHIQAVICSAYSDYSWMDIQKKLGVNDRVLVLKKPFDTVEIRQMAFALTEKWNLQVENLKQLQTLQTEVARRRQTDKELQNQELQIQSILNNSPSIIYIKDTDGRYLLVNNNYENVFDRASCDIIGKSDYDIFPEDLAKRLTSHDEQTLRALCPQEYDEMIPCHHDHTTGSHSERLFASCKFPLYNIKGEVYALGCISNDITERRALRKKIQQSEKLEAIGLLAGGVAHDFNNILGGISGAAELLEMKLADNEPLKKYAHTICTATQRAALLTKQLLHFSRNNTATQVPINIHTLTRDICAILQYSSSEHTHFDIHLADSDFITAGDPAELQQCILNIITNARDALPDGGTIHISSTINTVDMTGTLAIRDDGCGIADDIIERIFDPFFTTKGQHGGTGLGLAAVHGILESHHATLDIHSTPDVGSCFSITFCLHDSTPQSDAQLTALTATAGPALMVIDDEDNLRNITSEFLRAANYTVSEFSGGKSAIEAFTDPDFQCDAVLLDMMMPSMSGEDVFYELRAIRPDVPIILMTGYCHESILTALLKQQPCALLDKPFRSEKLCASVATLLTKAGISS